MSGSSTRRFRRPAFSISKRKSFFPTKGRRTCRHVQYRRACFDILVSLDAIAFSLNQVLPPCCFLMPLGASSFHLVSLSNSSPEWSSPNALKWGQLEEADSARAYPCRFAATTP